MSTLITNKQDKIVYQINSVSSIVSGTFPIISYNSKIQSDTNNIQGKTACYLSIKSSKLNSKNNILNTENYISICSNNSLQTIEQQNINAKYNFIACNNSFINFPYVYYNNDITKQVGGNLYIKNILNKEYIYTNNLKWSSRLVTDNGKQYGLYWQTLNQNSFITQQDNVINISIKNNKFYDQSNITTYLLYDNYLNGFFNNISFNFNEIYNTNVDGINLSNKKLNYSINNKNSNILNLDSATLTNVYLVTLDKINLHNLTIENSNIKINSNSDSLLSLNGNNSKIYSNFILNNIIDFSNLFNISIYSSSNTNNYIQLNEDITFYNKGCSIGYKSILDNQYEYNNLLFDKDIHPQLGNQLFTNNTIKSVKRNNAYKYGLQSHSHKLYNGITTSIEKGTIFPTQTLNNAQTGIQHKLYSNTNYKHLLKTTNKGSYYPTNMALNQQLLPQQVGVPVGSIVGFYQVKKGNEIWFPKVPYGFYQLKKDSSYDVKLDMDDPQSYTYNYQLYKILKCENGIITIPKGIIITINDGNARIIQILKYSQNWIINKHKIQ